MTQSCIRAFWTSQQNLFRSHFHPIRLLRKFERFWTKLTRYMGAGSRRKQTRRGRILMSSTVPVGGYLRVTAQLLDPSLQPVEQKTEPKITIRPVELDKYPPEIEKATGDETIAKLKAKFHEKYTQEFRMAAKKGPEKWEGYFQRAQLASRRRRECENQPHRCRQSRITKTTRIWL